uniref:Uncharacterized protein n=1 Tax=Globisporangium ultimum (strain ATCC 200006 / CBS 805.95 / DAOM BR144) TaxID=431595 RepID=K3W8X7_GLOUD
MDDEHFLYELEAYLDAHELLYPALWSLAEQEQHEGGADALSAALEATDAPLALDDIPWEELQAAADSSPVDAPMDPLAETTSLHSPSSEGWSSHSSRSDETASFANSKDQSRQRTRKKRNSTRDRMQSELKQLRTEAAELEQKLGELHVLQQQEEKVVARHQSEDALLLATWKRIAKRRLDEREHVESENRQLKKRVANQAALTRNLQECIQQMANVATWDPTAPNGREHIPQVLSCGVVTASAEDVAILERLIAELDAEFARLDRVFQESGLCNWQADISTRANSQMNMKRQQCGSHGDGGSLYIELLDAIVVPLELKLAYAVSWHSWELGKNCVVFDRKPANVSAYKTRIEISMDGEVVAFDFLNVTRSYQETSSRINCVWRGVTKADAHFPGVYIDETGWQVMEPILGDSIRPTTSIHTCSHLKSKRFSGTDVSVEDTQVSSLADVAVSTYESDMLQMNKMMKELLVQESHENANGLRYLQ